jgi:hypothetical protein
MSPGIAPREQQGAFLKAQQPKSGGACCKLVGGEAAEQVRPRQERRADRRCFAGRASPVSPVQRRILTRIAFLN